MRLLRLAAIFAISLMALPAGAADKGAVEPWSDNAYLGGRLQLLAENYDFDAAIREADAVESKVRRLGTAADLALLFAIRALARAETGDYERADADARTALELAGKSGHAEAEVRARNALGISAYRQGRHEAALAEYFQARVTAESIQDSRLAGVVLINIGITLRALGEPARALQYYADADEVLKDVTDPRLQATRAANRSRSLLDLGRSGEARTQIELALQQFRQIGDKRAEARSLRTLASMLIASSELDLASALVEQALAIDGALPSGLGLAADLLVRGQLRVAQGQLVAARADIDQARATAREHHNPTIERDASLAGSDLEAQAGDFRRAHELLRETRRLDEQLRGEGLRAHALDIEGRYRFDKQGKTIATLQKDSAAVQFERDRSAQERNMAMVAALGFLLFAALSLVLARSRARAATALRRTARSDPLTGLGNRRVIFESVEALCIRDRNAKLIVLVVDVDDFKSINDRFGHAAGDRALCAVAEVLRAHTRAGTDVVARWGGEEFLILLFATSMQLARERAEAIRARVEQAAVETPDGPARFTVTIGVAEGAACEFERVLAAADAAMYRGKGDGRNRVDAAAEVPSPTKNQDLSDAI